MNEILRIEELSDQLVFTQPAYSIDKNKMK